MPISATHLVTSASATNATSYTTASITPSPNKIIFLVVGSRRGGANPSVPTITGNNLTWTQQATRLNTAGDPMRITLFRATGLPSAGAITIDFGSEQQLNAGWTVNEFFDVDLGGTNGANAIVQTATNSADTGATSYSVTLGAFSSTDNATFSACYKDAINAFAPDVSFTELGEANPGSECAIQSQWDDGNDTTATADFTGSGGDAYVALAAEIKFKLFTPAGNYAYFM